MAQGEPILVGSSRLYVKDDTIIWICGEHVTSSDVQRGHEIFTEVAKQHGYVLLLGEIAALSSLPADARRQHSDWQRIHKPYFIVALTGGGLLSRTLVRLVLTAGRLVAGGSRTRFTYCDSEAHALEWLASQRELVRRELDAEARSVKKS